ncbi:MAG: hypothetical protein ACRCRP_01530 [Metamycoplasmataceae bacterium]
MKYYCSYDKKFDPYFWKLKKVNKEPHVFFKSRQDAINYYLSQKHEGVIWFQKDKNDLARGFVPQYEGYINSTFKNNKLVHEIKLFNSVKLLNPEETIKKLYNTWNLNQETGEDILTLNKIDRLKTILNSYLTSYEMKKFLENRKKQKIKKEVNSIENEELNFNEIPFFKEEQKNNFEYNLESDFKYNVEDDNFLNYNELDNLIYNSYKNNKGQNMNMKKKIYQPVGYIIPPNQTGTIEYTVVPGQTLNTAINPLGQETMIISSPTPQYNYVESIPQPMYVAAPQFIPQPIQVVQPTPNPYNYYSNPVYDYPNYSTPQPQSNIVESLTNEIKHMRNDLSQMQSKTQSLSFSRPQQINSLAITSEINNSVENFKNEIKKEIHDEFSYLTSQFNFSDMAQTDRKISDLKEDLRDIQENLRILLSNRTNTTNSNNYYNDIVDIKQELHNLNTTILNTSSSKNNYLLNDLNKIKDKIRDLSNNSGNSNTLEFGSDLRSIRNEIQDLKRALSLSNKSQPTQPTQPTQPVSPYSYLSPDVKSQDPVVVAKSKRETKIEAKEAKLQEKEAKIQAKEAKKANKQKLTKKAKVGLGFLFTFTTLLFAGAVTVVVLFFLGII